MTNKLESIQRAPTNSKQYQQAIAPALILIAVCPGAFFSHFSAGLVNIALPELSSFFQASLGTTQWLVTGYLLAVMITLPVMGKLADWFGRKTVHNGGYLVFGIGALLSALSLSLSFLLVARILQGIGAAMLQSSNMAIITAHYPEEKRGKALGIIGTAVGLGALLGPSVGGLLIQVASWRLLFWIQIPFILVVFMFAIRFVPKSPRNKEMLAQSFDYIGAALFGVSITSVIYVLNQIGEVGVDIYQLPISLVGIFCFVLFVFHTNKRTNPFIHLKLLAPPMVKGGSFIIVVSYMATFATMVVLPFYFIGILEVSASISGLLLMTYPLFLAIIGPISGGLADQFGSYRVVICGLITMMVSLLGLSMISEETAIVVIVLLLSLLGIAMGILTSPNYHLIISNVSFHHLGIISSTIALLRNLGMALGTAFGVTFMNLWVSGSITDWMADPDRSELHQVMLGFQSFFIFMTVLMVLALAVLVVQKKKREKQYPNMKIE